MHYNLFKVTDETLEAIESYDELSQADICEGRVFNPRKVYYSSSYDKDMDDDILNIKPKVKSFLEIYKLTDKPTELDDEF